ncbi:MAG: cytochrome b [Aestuariivirgaceae bacterium]
MTNTAAAGYSPLSIITHWLTAILVITLFVTHEASRGSAGYIFHVSGGAIAGLFLLWRVWHRIRQGLPSQADQAFILNLAARIVQWGFLVSIVVVVITGYFLPWSIGRPLDIFGFVAIPSPMSANRAIHELIEEVHEVSGQLFVPLLALHILGTAKHAFVDRDGVARRMFSSVPRGR